MKPSNDETITSWIGNEVFGSWHQDAVVFLISGTNILAILDFSRTVIKLASEQVNTSCQTWSFKD